MLLLIYQHRRGCCIFTRQRKQRPRGIQRMQSIHASSTVEIRLQSSICNTPFMKSRYIPSTSLLNSQGSIDTSDPVRIVRRSPLEKILAIVRESSFHTYTCIVSVVKSLHTPELRNDIKQTSSPLCLIPPTLELAQSQNPHPPHTPSIAT